MLIGTGRSAFRPMIHQPRGASPRFLGRMDSRPLGMHPCIKMHKTHPCIRAKTIVSHGRQIVCTAFGGRESFSRDMQGRDSVPLVRVVLEPLDGRIARFGVAVVAPVCRFAPEAVVQDSIAPLERRPSESLPLLLAFCGLDLLLGQHRFDAFADRRLGRVRQGQEDQKALGADRMDADLHRGGEVPRQNLPGVVRVHQVIDRRDRKHEHCRGEGPKLPVDQPQKVAALGDLPHHEGQADDHGRDSEQTDGPHPRHAVEVDVDIHPVINGQGEDEAFDGPDAGEQFQSSQPRIAQDGAAEDDREDERDGREGGRQPGGAAVGVAGVVKALGKFAEPERGELEGQIDGEKDDEGGEHIADCGVEARRFGPVNHFGVRNVECELAAEEVRLRNDRTQEAQHDISGDDDERDFRQVVFEVEPPAGEVVNESAEVAGDALDQIGIRENEQRSEDRDRGERQQHVEPDEPRQPRRDGGELAAVFRHGKNTRDEQLAQAGEEHGEVRRQAAEAHRQGNDQHAATDDAEDAPLPNQPKGK